MVRDKEGEFEGEDLCTGQAGLVVCLCVFVHIKQWHLLPLAPGGPGRCGEGNITRTRKLSIPMESLPTWLLEAWLSFLALAEYQDRGQGQLPFYSLLL